MILKNDQFWMTARLELLLKDLTPPQCIPEKFYSATHCGTTDKHQWPKRYGCVINAMKQYVLFGLDPLFQGDWENTALDYCKSE